jgi:hypothetical protein
MRRLRKLAPAALLLAGIAAVSVAGSAAGQEMEIPPPATPVTVYLVDRPLVTVTFNGQYGPVRASGTVADAPRGTFRLVSPEGSPREAALNEVRTMSVVDFPSEGFPSGSVRVELLTDPVRAETVQSAGITRSYGSSLSWRLERMPEGTLRLSGSPYGELEIPMERLVSLRMQPVRGTVTQFPAGSVRMEIQQGKPFDVPIESIQSLQRDPRTGRIDITLLDDQSYSGRLVQLPSVALPLTGEDGMVRPIPFDRIVVFERPTLGVAGGRF